MKILVAEVVIALSLLAVSLESILVTYGQVYLQEQPTNLTKLFEKENFSQGEDPVTILHQSPDMIVIKESTTNPLSYRTTRL